ncbi:MAG: methyltransferase domain-containing protein [Phaeodactylibacter sp.]|nr:methyltransferase domain-containing protein [Phaeodactylibacter sp.]MCB9274888.1 methyltransferase domain-containing protein [Lewinellaceae bacterium]
MNLRWKVAQAAEIRWWKAYLARKEPLHYLRRKAAYWFRVLETTGMSPLPDGPILDAGCGPAGIFIILEGHAVDALDPLLPQYEAALPHFRPGDYPYARFLPVPLEDFLPGPVYETVFCLNAINHVSHLGRSMEALARCLRPGGRLVLSIDAHNHHLLKKLFQALPGDILHPHQHSLDDYRRMLENRGLQIERTVRMKKGFIFDYHLLVARKPLLSV